MTSSFAKSCAIAVAILFAVTGARAAERYLKVTIPNGLATAVTGDWVEFRLRDGRNQRVSILDREGSSPDGKVSIRTEHYLDGKILDSRRVSQAIGEEFVEPPAERDGEKGDSFGRRRGTAIIQGGEAEVSIIDVYKGDRLLRTWYLSPEIPVYGVLKLVRGDGTSEFEVVDFGVADGAK